MNTKFLFIVCSILLCSGCSATEPNHLANTLTSSAAATESSVQAEHSDQTIDGRIDVTTSQNHNIELYPLDQRDGAYYAFLLKAKDTEKQFPWMSSALPEDKPQVFATDLTQDGKDEAVVILTLGRGTGLHQQEAHIVDLKHFSEIPIPDPEEVLAQHITSKVIQKGDHLEVNVQTAERTITFQQEYIGGWHRDTLGFGAVVYYSVTDSQLIYETYALSGIEQVVGKAKIVYTYDKTQKKLKAESVTFTTDIE